MNKFSFFIFFFSFLNYCSFPLFFNPGYTQILPLIILNIYLLFSFSNYLLKKYINLIFLVLPFLIYSSIIYFDFTLFYKYIISISQLASWLTLVRLSKKDFHTCLTLNRVFLIMPIFLFLTQLVQIFSPEVYSFISLFKSFQQDITVGIRGYPGILPEPGYVGATISTTIVGFYTSKNILRKEYNFYKSFRNFYEKLFLIICFISVVLSLSFASYVSTFIILIGFLLCNISLNFEFLRKKLSLKNLSLFFIFLYIFFIYGINNFKYTRVFVLSEELFKNPLKIVKGLDESAADRFNSSFIGFATPFINPFGFGLNAYPRIFKDCNNEIPSTFDLMCENEFNSQRNNNIFANFTQDAGLIGLLTIILITLYTFNNLLINVKKLIITIFILFIGIFLPFPLGASIFWILTSYLVAI